MIRPCDDMLMNCTGLAGCGGRLCRNMRHALSKMEFVSYDINEMGEAEPAGCGREMLCGFITRLSPPSEPGYAVPGIIGTASNVRLTVVSSTTALKVNDIVYADGKCYRVQLQLSEQPIRFSLVETEEI